MLKLNIPEAVLDIERRPDGTLAVYDPLRRRHVALTPEEYVRQNFVDFLIKHKGFPAGMMANEVSLTLNATARRCDTVVFDRSRRPLVIVEYKAPMVAISSRTFDQIARYNLVLQARYLIVSNGLSHYCCRYDGEGYTFLPDIPDFSAL